ncbi:Oidioi.mRNA.OKI2018_I69.chr2.g5057.t1.cds [Oikopleura dioica]|uniref:Oidioi.mRNA.OKI2018_I69.chr2.g5057.t1.cds n=1 Tax=Oikopleura dioica TaxID=34765 RepID=A0ABN7T529_OIKDI|nr:Oidioi.mRNA.OKI2018_I69.chr2.g5057.t1.cds [Oikopleura dioica]
MLEPLKNIVDKVLKYSTPFGHAWSGLLFFFRLLPTLTIGQEIFDDEQEEFVCTSGQPACTEQCYNEFSPISHHRLWSLQVLVTIIPILLFSFIATQVQAKHKLYSAYVSSFEEKQSKSSAASKSASMLSSDHDRFIYAQAKNKLSHYEVKTKRNLDGEEEEIIWHPDVKRSYILISLVKICMETLFIYQLYLLQMKQTKASGFFNREVWLIPEEYKCDVGLEDHFACSADTDVPCYVSRAWEKRIFVIYYIIVSILSFLFLVFDIVFVIYRIAVTRRRKKNTKRTLLVPNDTDDRVSVSSRRARSQPNSRAQSHPRLNNLSRSTEDILLNRKETEFKPFVPK